MKRGFLLYQFKVGGVFRIFLLFLVGVGISGCGAMAEATPAKPVVCTPQATNVNIYRATSSPDSMQILTPAPISNGTPQTGIGSIPNDFTQEQLLAFLQQTSGQQTVSIGGISDFGALIYETKSWSAIQTIKLDDVSQAQVVVTFLSPQLIKTIYGNEMRVYGAAAGVDIQTVLDEIAKRDELIFFVMVVTTTNNNLGPASHKILIPIREMVIVNAEDVIAPPLRDDHKLAMEINTSLEPAFGYLTYPFAMQRDVNCSWVLNPTYNKTIFITVPHIDVDGISTGAYMWEIPYFPLFSSGLPAFSPGTVAFDSTQTTSSLTPPAPMKNLLVTNGMDESVFWQAYARFLWKRVVLRNY